MKIIPFADKIYIKLLKRPDKIRGVIVPEKYRQITEKAEVESIGERVKYFKPKDKILIQNYSGKLVQTKKSHPEEFMYGLITEGEALAKYKEEDGKLNIIAADDKLYIKVLDRPSTMRGIPVPNSYSMATEKAEVISAGEKITSFKPGDKILVYYSSGIHIQTEETYTESSKHRLIREHEILAKYED